MEKAYELAKQFGYDGRVYSKHGELLDPKFWQALGRALGWEKQVCAKCGYPAENLGVYCGGCDTELDIIPYPEWLYHWHRFVDHLAEGKPADEFFAVLLGEEGKI